MAQGFTGPCAKLFSKTLEWLVINQYRERFYDCNKLYSMLNQQQTLPEELLNCDAAQKHIHPVTFCACVFLKPQLFADNLNLRVVVLKTAYKYNQELKRLVVDKEVTTTNIKFVA